MSIGYRAIKRIPLPLPLLMAMLLVLVSNLSVAHTPLKSSSPSDGAVIAHSPQQITLTFREPVILAKAELTTNGNSTVDTGFKAGVEKLASYSITLPELTNGQYQLNWVAIGADTHKIEGKLTFSVNASVEAEASPH